MRTPRDIQILRRTRRRARRRAPRAAIVLGLALVVACGGRSRPAPQPPTGDERYLIETYVQIQRAAGQYRSNPARADSVLAALSARVDSLRIERTLRALDRSPERWALVFQEIERRLRSPQAPTPGSSERVP